MRAARRAQQQQRNRFAGVRPLHDLGAKLREAGREAAGRVAESFAIPLPLAA
jgi:hypothetical protein